MHRIIIGLLLVSAAPAQSQVLRGRVLVDATAAPISGVRVSATDSAGAAATASSDSAGRFIIRLARAGSYTLTAEHVAYRAARPSTLAVERGEEIALEIRMAESAVPLDPITVVARRGPATGALQGYYDRLEWNSRLGIGRFVTREHIERFTRGRVTDYLIDIPFVQIRGISTRTVVLRQRGAECTPKVFADGLRVPAAALDDVMSVADLEGIEIYRGTTESPAEYWDTDGCGVILAWTRRGPDAAGRRLNLKRLLLLGGAVVLIGVGIAIR